MMNRSILLLLLSIICTAAFAQEVQGDTVIDMRSSGKIYVVIAVLLIVFIGIALYLFSIDKRLKKIERDN